MKKKIPSIIIHHDGGDEHSIASKSATIFSLIRPTQRRWRRSKKNTSFNMGNSQIQSSTVGLSPSPYEHYPRTRRRRSKGNRDRPSTMLQLIARRDWQKVLLRASESPGELSEKYALSWYGIDAKVLPIHLACALQPPPKVIEKLLYFHADTANMTITKRKIAKKKKKYFLRRNREKDFTLRKSNTDPTTTTTGSSDNIIAGNQIMSPLDISESRRMVLQLGPTGNLRPIPTTQPRRKISKIRPLLQDIDCLLPLHLACLYQASPGVICHLLKANPESVKTIAWGMLPIHMICANFCIPPPIAASSDFFQLASELKLADSLRPLIQYYPESVHITCFQSEMTPKDYINETMEDGKSKTQCLLILGGEDVEEEYYTEERQKYEDTRNLSYTTDTLSTNSEEQLMGVPLEIRCFEEMSPVRIDFNEAENMKWQLHNPLYSSIHGEEWEEAFYLLEDEPELANQWQYGIEIDDCNEPQLWKRLPIHNACRFGAPIPLLSALLQLNPNYAADPYTGSLPIHLACQYSPYPETIQLILINNPLCARKKNKKGQLPMHLACCRGAPTPTIEYLLKAFPGAVRCKDKNGKTPLDYSDSLDPEICKVMERLQTFLERVERRKQEECSL